MKSIKENVYEYVRQTIYTNASYAKGVETREIAAALGKQRSNISAALNELIKEGRLVKSETRPVLYRLPEQAAEVAEEAAYQQNKLIGLDGSLQNAAQLAKAAILYPKHPLNVLLSSKGGCGTTYFVEFMYQYATEKGVLKTDAPLVKINCRHYTKKLSVLKEELFGTEKPEGNCFERARGGMLFIDYFDLLDVRQQARIFSFLETGYIEIENKRVNYSDVYLVLSCYSQNMATLKRRIPVAIELPELKERPLEERFALVNYFFETEARELKRNIEIPVDVIKALLITDYVYNVKELRHEVLTACANAYVRVASTPEQNITICMDDFRAVIKHSMLEIKNYTAELQEVLGKREYWEYVLYDQVTGYQSQTQKQANDGDGRIQNLDTAEKKPVLLYVMHGSGTARSLCEVTNALSYCDNAYSYDLALEMDAKTAMSELKALVKRIDRGAGIIVIYDMGSIKTMLDAIAEELHIKIYYEQIPITMIGIETAHKCAAESDIDNVFHMVSKEIREQRYNNEPRNSVIITLCHTGDGGAMYLKNYIDQHSRLGIKTIALGISDRKILLKEAMELKRTYSIHAFVGTYDPKLMGIPFVSMTKLLEVAPENIDRVLMFEPVSSPAFDYSKVYDSLEEQLKYTSIAKLKSVLPQVVDELALMYSLDSARMQGIFIHLACVVERILSGGKLTKNPDAKRIIRALEEDYRAISRILKNLEKVFKIIIDDNEIATLIMILKQI